MNKKGNGLKLLMGIGVFLVLTLIFSGITLIVFDDYTQETKVSEWNDASAESEMVEELPVEEEIPEYDAYHFLYDEEKGVYWKIVEGIMNYETDIEISGVDSMEIERVMAAIDIDFPEIFWADTFSYYYDEKSEIVSKVEVSYPYDEAEKDRRQLEIDQAYEEYLSGMNNSFDVYDVVRYTYEYVVKNTTYQENEDDQNIYSVFGLKASVCAGYAKAVKYLLDEQGIDCSYVSGYVELQGAHAWNLVQIDEEYYYLDATWGELGVKDNSEPEKNISYDYFCVTSDQLLKTHELDQTLIFYPRFSATAANYFVHERKLYDMNDETDKSRFRNDVTIALGEGDKYFYFAVKNQSMMDEAQQVMDETLGTYSFFSDEDLCTYTIMLY